MATKLMYKVVSFSSEDPDYPAAELNTVSPNTRGWQSIRMSEYPQELGFELRGKDSQISQLQLLSHQTKISSKIEIFIGTGSSYKTAHFSRLGHLSLDSNERSDYSARELKTVYIDNIVGSYIKLIINRPHNNSHNIYSQVGIIALCVLGTDSDTVASPKSNGKYHAAGHKSSAPGNNYNDLSIDLNLDPQTAAKLRQLSEAKTRAVDAEDYPTAKRIKEVEQDLKTQGMQLAQLDMAKSDAVLAEDYDLAKEIKDKSDDLRRRIEDQIMNINIPGVVFSKPAPQVKPSRPKFAPAESEDRDEPMSSRRGYGGESPVKGNSNNNAFDELHVGAKHHSSGKMVAKVEAVHHDAYDDRIGHDDHDDNPAYYSEIPDPEAHLHPLDRAIKPKSSTYEEPMGGIDDDPNAYRGGGGGSLKAAESFPPGQHPLQGVEKCESLPAPEALAKKSRELADQFGIISLLGEYHARCLFSKTWVLREAALAKVQLMVEGDLSRDNQALSSALPALVGIIKVGVEDKIHQVLFAAIGLMDDLILKMKSQKIARALAQPLFDPVLAQLTEKTADGNQRLRDGGKRGLELLAASPHVGPAAVCNHAARALPAKQKTAWRPIASRLEVLTDLVNTYGLGGSSGMSAEGVLGFSKSHAAYAHSTAEVRAAAQKLVVAVYRQLGKGAVQSALDLLRPKQLEEYTAAFDEGGAAAQPKKGPSGAQAQEKNREPPAASPTRVDKHLQHATHAPGGKVPTSAAKGRHGDDVRASMGAKGGEDGGEEAQDFTSCMFCGVHDKAWTENDLDVHYWKDCPLLISCPSCAQIVEIAGLPEHLLDECDEKDSYTPCETTGLAIKSKDFPKWQKSTNCVPAPKNCMYCPLCLASVEDSDDAWLAHLTKGCPRNARTNGST